MTEFEKALQECLRAVEQGNSSVDECLHRYPSYADQLEPVLLTSAYLQRGREARPSAAFKARVRTKLIQQMYARPRQRPQSKFMFMRFAVGFAVVLLALLVAGTAYAQSTLPGNAFYAWKLTSEQAWRSVSPDPVGTDLAIAERRLNELIAVRNDPTRYSLVLQAYVTLVDRLKSEVDTESKARILAVLDSQAEELHQSGIVVPSIDENILSPSDEPNLIPTLPPPATPLPVLNTPQVNPTDLPEIIPTLKVPSEIVPTIRVPSPVVPTIQVPSLSVPVTQDAPRIIPTIGSSLPIP